MIDQEEKHWFAFSNLPLIHLEDVGPDLVWTHRPLSQLIVWSATVEIEEIYCLSLESNSKRLRTIYYSWPCLRRCLIDYFRWVENVFGWKCEGTWSQKLKKLYQYFTKEYIFQDAGLCDLHNAVFLGFLMPCYRI